MGLSERLEAVTHKAIDKLEEIIDERNERADEDFVPIARIQTDASKTMLNAKIRVDEAGFRVRQSDQLDQILQTVLARKAALAGQTE